MPTSSGTTAAFAPADTTVVTWLPFYHDMGLHLGVIFPVLTGFHTWLNESSRVSAAAGPVDQFWQGTVTHFRRA